MSLQSYRQRLSARRSVLVVGGCLIAAIAAGCGGGDRAGELVEAPVLGADSKDPLVAPPTARWFTNGGSVYNQRYSPLDRINADNVARLRGEWQVDLGSALEEKHSAETQPIFDDGVLYVSTGENDVFAIDVETGDRIWTYEGDLSERITTVCCGWTSRGVALGEGRVYVNKLDGNLVALDRDDGRELWRTRVGRWQDGVTMTSAPLYYDGMVITGISGGEYGIRGHVTAYDASNGQRRWRFHTIPGPGDRGHGTWPQDNDAWRNGGGPVWHTPAVDPELGMIYFVAGNTSPDFNGSARPGANLFANSIIALDVATGKYRWHFQQVHHDIWDYDPSSPPVLFDLAYDGEMRRGLAQAGKTGWVYILDRTNGEPLVGIEEREVPQNDAQRTAATQPHPEGDSFVAQEISEDEAEQLKEDRSEEHGWEYVNEGRIFTPFYGQDGIIAKPGTLGGNNWPPPSFNPSTGQLYVCALDETALFTSSEVEYDPQAIAEGAQYRGSVFTSPEGVERRGTFTAMSLLNNRITWQKQWADACYSGSLSTGGSLVFVGDNEGRLIAYDAENGDELWSFATGAGANAPPTTFEHKGTQYIAFYAGGNSLMGTEQDDNLWLFSLDGSIASGGETAAPVSSGEEQKPEDDEEVAAGTARGPEEDDDGGSTGHQGTP